MQRVKEGAAPRRRAAVRAGELGPALVEHVVAVVVVRATDPKLGEHDPDPPGRFDEWTEGRRYIGLEVLTEARGGPRMDPTPRRWRRQDDHGLAGLHYRRGRRLDPEARPLVPLAFDAADGGKTSSEWPPRSSLPSGSSVSGWCRRNAIGLGSKVARNTA
jgi:hypothetical protein